jgi:NAD(P)-dependent dehydrogenase (short-subunit alcohol dehydrogenase family)
MPPKAARFRSAASFTGRGVLVLGATTGIGRATVLAFARLGACVCFAGRGAREGEAVAEEARRLGAADASFMEIDIRQEADVRAMIALAESRFGRIEIAVNNAGVESPVAPLQESGDEEFERVMGVNVRGPCGRGCWPECSMAN